MKRTLLLLSVLTLLFAACSKQQARDVAGSAAENTKSAAKAVATEGKIAADRMEDVVNDRNVTIDDFLYRPSTKTIRIGTEITWVNHGRVQHTVTSDNNVFDSDQIKAETGEFSNRVTQKGTYKYHCENHPTKMMGTIVVTG